MYDYKVVFEINGHHRYEQIVRATSDNKARELIYAQYGPDVHIISARRL